MKEVTQDSPAMELPILLVADYANISREGKVNVMGIFDRITTETFPTLHPQMVLVMKLTAGPGEYGATRKLRVTLTDADAKAEIVDWASDVEVPTPDQPGKRVEINQFLGLVGLVFPAPGTYTFYVMVDNDLKGSIPIHLEKI